MIPKVIHCFWAGGPKTPIAEKCRASWARFAPDCEVREWCLDDFMKMSNVPDFCTEAVRRKKWAFVSDWVRCRVLYEHGGVYFDFDEELVQPLPEGMFEEEWCAGEYRARGDIGAAPGAGLALRKESGTARAMLRYYETNAFSENLTIGEILAGLDIKDIKILPPERMSPMGADGRMHRSKETLGIHHYAMSWATPARRIARWLSWHGMRGLVDFALRLKGARK